MKSWQYFLGAIATSLAITVGVGSKAQAFSRITFDELEEGTSIDGLTVNGVTFDYKVFGEDSDGAFVTNFGDYPPSLSGNALLLNNGNSVLSLDFDDPIDVFKFSADWICTFGDSCLSQGAEYTVKLFNETLSSWQEFNPGQSFRYTGSPISRVVFEFNPDKVEEFAIDNIVFNKVGNPEPVTILGSLALGIAGLARAKKVKR